MKRIFVFFLAVCMVFSLVACSGDPLVQSTTNAGTATEEPQGTSGSLQDSKGNYILDSVEDLELLRQFPTATFTVAAEIDLGGATWEPIESFSGKISGQWNGTFNHTISNFVIEAKAGDTEVGLSAI